MEQAASTFFGTVKSPKSTAFPVDAIVMYSITFNLDAAGVFV